MGGAFLVVDDSETFRRTAVTLLNLRGFTEVAAVAGMNEALAEVARGCPAAVLIDVNLIGISGYEAAAAISEVCPGARVVLTSAEIERIPDDVLAGCGVVAFVPKSALASVDLRALFLDGGRPLSPGRADT